MSAHTPLQVTDEGIAEAVSMLAAGRCVAFPTETVYGLGANALDEAAVRSIFRFKGRPLTDPLIVHVDTAAKALTLVSLPSKRAEDVFRTLAERFWPGPLTLVAKACDAIPLTVTAGTGFVGVRVPNHPIALRLLKAADLPIAAPSANRFGHVSPTRASHVIADLGEHPIGVIVAETETEQGEKQEQQVTCGVGIESTVVKVEQTDATIQLVVFRRGGVSMGGLREALSSAGFFDVDIVFRTMHSTAPASSSSSAASASSTPAPAEPAKHSAVADTPSASEGAIEGGSEAPGMLLVHYAPDGLETYLCRPAAATYPSLASGASTSSSSSSSSPLAALLVSASDDEVVATSPSRVPLHHCAVLDFGGTLKRSLGLSLSTSSPASSGAVAGYRELSASGSVAEAASNLFDSLRWTETVSEARYVLIADPGASGAAASSATSNGAGGGGAGGAIAGDIDVDALRDRMFRAASGKVVTARLDEQRPEEGASGEAFKGEKPC